MKIIKQNLGSVPNSCTHGLTQPHLNPADNSALPVRRIRTLIGIVEHYRSIDPETAITVYFLRQKILDGTLPFSNAGTKRLVAIEDVETMLKNTTVIKVPQPQHGPIQRVDYEQTGV